VHDAPLVIEAMQATDAARVLEIYRQGIATGHATFETEVPRWDAWDQKHLSHSRVVARVGPTVIGWAALTPVSARAVYAGVAEVSVYVAENVRAHGVGRALLRALIQASEHAGIWTLQAGIFPENRASIKLHRWCGFREVGVRERIGRMGDRWRDVVLFERRSPAIEIGRAHV